MGKKTVKRARAGSTASRPVVGTITQIGPMAKGAGTTMVKGAGTAARGAGTAAKQGANAWRQGAQGYAQGAVRWAGPQVKAARTWAQPQVHAVRSSAARGVEQAGVAVRDRIGPGVSDALIGASRRLGGPTYQTSRMQRLSEFGSRRWPQMVAGAAMLAAAGSAVAAVRLKRQAESDLGPEDDLVTNGSGEWRGATRTADRGYGPPPPEPPYEEPLPGPPPPGPGPAYGPPPGGPPLGSDDIPPPPGGGDIPPGGRGPIPPSGPIPPGR